MITQKVAEEVRVGDVHCLFHENSLLMELRLLGGKLENIDNRLVDMISRIVNI